MGSTFLINLLRSFSDIFVDSTFYIALRSFNQILTIIGKYEDKIFFPGSYAHLSHKTTDIYNKLFLNLKSILKQSFFNSDWKNVHLDFEPAHSKAFSNYFPKVKKKFCFFHFKKYILRKITDVRMRNRENMQVSKTLVRIFLTVFFFKKIKQRKLVFLF